jgi:hypothetical protein
MSEITSNDTWIICPKSKQRHQIHDCILSGCKYEHGHTISDSGSRIHCTFGEGKQAQQKRPRAAYRNIKNHRPCIDGITFASPGEAERYLELDIMRLKGEILSFTCQPVFELQPKFRKNGVLFRPIRYIADFYVVHNDKSVMIEDAKGWGGYTTPDFKIKRKMFEFKNPDLILVLLKRTGKSINTLKIVRDALQKEQK